MQVQPQPQPQPQTQSMSHTKTKYSCWKNGELVSADQAVVSIYDHGLLYGDGCFEGLRFYHRHPFRLDRHLARLRRSLSALAITVPYTDDTLAEAVMACIARSGMGDGYLRILVTRGEGDMGLNPRNCTAPNVFKDRKSNPLRHSILQTRSAVKIRSGPLLTTGGQ